MSEKEDLLTMPKTPWYVKGICVAVLVAAGVGGWMWWKAQGDKNNVHYITEAVARGPISVTVTADGTLQPMRTVSLGSELSGVVRKVYVDVNSVIHVGDPLIDLDTRKLESNVASAKASVQSARAQRLENQANLRESQLTLNRMKDLNKRSNGLSPSKTELEQQEAKVDVNKALVAVSDASIADAEATLKTAETELSKAKILSPIDGVVLARDVEPGLAVAASLQAVTLLTLASDLSQLELRVSVDEADIGVVKPGDPVYFTVSAYPNQHFPAELKKVAYGATTTENVVTYTAYMSVDNTQKLLRPGMTATATIQTDKKDNVLLIPNSALRFTPTAAKGSGAKKPAIVMGPPIHASNKTVKEQSLHGEAAKDIYVLRDGQAVKVSVVTGLTDGVRTEVISGDLQDNDQVIIDQQRASGS